MTWLVAVACALFGWWLSTGLVLYLNNLPRRTYPLSMAAVSVAGVASLAGLATGSDQAGAGAALLAFLQALVVWAWLEMSYFMGMVTGPNRLPCPEGAKGLARFRLALGTSIYHELSVIAVGAIVLYLVLGQPNPFGAYTFLTLWLMRWSAKLNLYLGVANVNVEWFPLHLRYLSTYIRRRPINVLFPFSVTAASVVFAHLVGRAAAAADPLSQAGYATVATLLFLALLEHFFLVLRLGDAAMWSWALKAARRRMALTNR